MADMVRVFHDEVLRHFPEVATSMTEGDEELPYIVALHLVDWLRTVALPTFDPDVIRRVVEFDRWCKQQPDGATAADDIHTIETVGFLEALFEHDELIPLLSHLIGLEELTEHRDYFITWVGAERYAAALSLIQSSAS